MSKKNPILIVEDDPDDRELIGEALKDSEILNPLKFFVNGEEAFEFLQNTAEQPFLILSDINLPLMTGIELREKIDSNNQLRKKNIPFVFFTTSSDSTTIDKAYEMIAQGYFIKENTFDEIKSVLKMIVDYWTKARHPNS